MKNANPNNANELRELMKKHKLTRYLVAYKTCYSEGLVDGWLSPVTSPAYRPMRDRVISHLKMALGEI